MILTLAFIIAILIGVCDSIYTRKEIHAGRMPGVKPSKNMLDYMLGDNE
jgi:hypothetical protein